MKSIQTCSSHRLSVKVMLGLCHRIMLIFSIILLLSESVRSIKLLDLRVPAHVLRGARAHLSCSWQLGPTEVLYSVKWYKDGMEFFRHVPRNEEQWAKFTLPGVDVEDSDASGANLTLSPVSLKSSGRYRCEVSGEKPLFPTVSNHADMEVIVLPNRGPMITGFHSRYRTGDKAKLNCTSGWSWPPTQLAWYINGEPAPLFAIHQKQQKNDKGLVVTSVLLDFNISEKIFTENQIKVKCLATLFPFYWRSNDRNAMKQWHTDTQETIQNKKTLKMSITNRIRVNSSYRQDSVTSVVIILAIILCTSFKSIP